MERPETAELSCSGALSGAGLDFHEGGPNSGRLEAKTTETDPTDIGFKGPFCVLHIINEFSSAFAAVLGDFIFAVVRSNNSISNRVQLELET